MKIKEKFEDCIDGIKGLKGEIKQAMMKKGVEHSLIYYGNEVAEDVKAAAIRCFKDAQEMVQIKPKSSNLRK